MAESERSSRPASILETLDPAQFHGHLTTVILGFIHHQFREPHDGIERRTQIVTGRGKELTLELARSLSELLGTLVDFRLPTAAQVVRVIQGLGDGLAEVLQINRLGLEIEGSAIHRHSDIRGVTVSGDDHGRSIRRGFLQFPQ